AHAPPKPEGPPPPAAAGETDQIKEQGPPESFSDRMMKQLDFEATLAAYQMFCKGESVKSNGVKLDQIINFYNEAMKDLPDVNTLKNYKLQETAEVLDLKGERFSEIYSENNRRIVVPISQIPDHVKKAFVAAEDQNFYKHNGIDVFGIIRAFAS